jgi:hypothetical protein
LINTSLTHKLLIMIFQNVYGFKDMREDDGWPLPRHEAVFFSKTESEAIFSSLKSADSGKGFTLTYLGMSVLRNSKLPKFD